MASSYDVGLNPYHRAWNLPLFLFPTSFGTDTQIVFVTKLVGENENW
jgi:hypothetical protein